MRVVSTDSTVVCSALHIYNCYLPTGPLPPSSTPLPPPSLVPAVVTSPPHLLSQPHSGNMVASCLSWLLSQKYIKIEAEINRNVYGIRSNLCNVLIIGKQNFNFFPLLYNPWSEWISEITILVDWMDKFYSVFLTMFLAHATNFFP